MTTKNLLIIASALGISLNFLNAYAANSTSLATAKLKPGMEYSIAAVWLKPGASNLNYVIYNKGLPLQSPSWTEKEIQPSYSPGFTLGIRYIFPNIQDVDVNLNWTHLSTNDSSSISTDSNSYFLGPDYEIGPSGIPIRNASGKVTFNYDVVNLDVGQFIRIGESVHLRFFGGLSTAFLRENVIANYSGNTTGTYAGPFHVNQNVVSNFTGVGPRFGIYADNTTQSGFGFFGEAAVSALIGSMYSKTGYVSSAQQLLTVYNQTSNSQTIADDRVYQTVPAFDAKLGINYTYALKNNALLTIAAGYQAAVYINAISQYLPASLVPNQGIETGGIFVATMSHTLSNYSVQGPFLNFTLKI